MKALFKILIAAALVASAAAASAGKPFPEQSYHARVDLSKLGPPTFVMDIKWVRAYSPIPEFRDGTCYVYAQDVFQRESTLEPLGDQIMRCAALGARVVNDRPIDGARRVRVHLVPETADVFAVTRIMEKLFGEKKPSMSLKRGTPSHGIALTLGGLYVDPDAASGGEATIIGVKRALGHELKHVFEGEYHNVRGAWLPVPNTKE